MSQQKKIALITGANKGIGLETARQLGKLGNTVLIGARDQGRGEQAAAQLRSEGIDARFLHLDVVNPAHIAAAKTAIEHDFGHLDILINNAGVMLESEDMMANTSATVSQQDLRATFDTNFFAVVALTQALLPLIRKSPAGRIVNVSSILGSITFHATPKSPIYDAKLLAYDSSKAALNSFTVHLAHALRDTKIKVNSAHPGWVKTEMGGDGAMLEIPEGAKTEVDLATLPDDGPTSSYIHLDKTLPW